MLLLQLPDTTGRLVTTRDGTLDFGPTPSGTSSTLPLTVLNSGDSALLLAGFTRLEGDPASALPGVDEAMPVFELSFGEALQVPARGFRTVDVTFRPPVDGAGAKRTVLTLSASGPAPGEDQVRLTLVGVSTPIDCEVPAFDFGAVAVGDTASLTTTLSNQTPAPRVVTLAAPQSTPPGLFKLAASSPPGQVTLQPGASFDVTVNFTPPAAGDFRGGELGLSRGSGCPERIPLRGDGVSQTLTSSPASLDFGYLTPGLSTSRAVTFSNLAFRPAQLTGLALAGAPGFTDFTLAGGVTALTVPPATRGGDGALVAGTAALSLDFSPTALVARSAVLRADTGLTRQPTWALGLRGTGGGPDIDVSPAHDVGQVAYFVGASPPSSATRHLQVRNAGTRPSPADPRFNLRLGTPDATGAPQRPYWLVTAANPGTLASELCVGAVDAQSGACLGDLGAADYEPAVGLVAPGVLSLPLRVTPASLGQKAWRLQLFSNDPDEPTVTVAVTADVVQLPPCSFRLSSSALGLGRLVPGRNRELSVIVENTGTQPSEVCLVDGVSLEPEAGRPPAAPPVFSLPVTPPQRSLGPGEQLELRVRALPLGVWPSTSTPITGGLRLSVSSPFAGGSVRVPLAAEVGSSCLVVTPDAFDFGAVGQGCHSAVRDFAVYNGCAAPITLHAVDLPLAGGAPAGSAACPGASPCPAYTLVGSGPSLPLTLQPLTSPVVFQVQYQPVDRGLDPGALVLRTTEGGQAAAHVVPLTARGDALGLNHDTVVVPREADVLLVIEADTRIETHRTWLAQHPAVFTEYASAHTLDYRLGFTAVDWTPPLLTEQGQLLPWTSGARVVTPGTANRTQEFLALPALGHLGSATEMCLAPALAAVSAPLANDPAKNLGLLRPDAPLGIVCLTSAGEQSPLPAFLYRDLLRQVKGTQRPGLLSFSVVGPFNPPPPSGCIMDGWDADGSLGATASQLRGWADDVCVSDPSALEALWRRLGRTAFGYREDFFLTAPPDLSSRPLEVRVNGVALPATTPGGTPAWEWQPVDNTVHFQAPFVPAPGQRVEFVYQVACAP